MLYFFTWRDLKVRYKQTAIGILWALIQPFTTMIVFSVFFGAMAKVPSDNVPYPIFVYVGLLFWQFFSSAWRNQQRSHQQPINHHQSLLSSPYPPSLLGRDKVRGFYNCGGSACYDDDLLRLSPAPERFADNPNSFDYHFYGLCRRGLLLAAVNVKYRDVRYALPFSFKFFFSLLLLFIRPALWANIPGSCLLIP